MEALDALQEKVEALLVLVKELKATNSALTKENEKMHEKLDGLMKNSRYTEDTMQELHQEKNRTKHVVQDLIKSIDSFISTQN